MPNLNQGPYVSKGVLSKFKLGLNFIDWISTPSSSLQNYELELLITTELIMLELKPTASLVKNTWGVTTVFKRKKQIQS